MIFSRFWAMPTADTFDCEPIKGFVQKYLLQSKVSVDPFARNSRLATHTNDLNPNTCSQSHMESEEFLNSLAERGIFADLLLFDPPYSPRQISECYNMLGKLPTGADTQNAALYQRVRVAALPMLSPNAVVLSFGWNSVGMGKANGFVIEEILLVCHGGAHNDTICLAERRVIDNQNVLL